MNRSTLIDFLSEDQKEKVRVRTTAWVLWDMENCNGSAWQMANVLLNLKKGIATRFLGK